VNLAACARLRRKPVGGVWYRAIALEYLKDDPHGQKGPLATAHTKDHPSRFSAGPYAPRPFETLYLCQHHVLALWEVEAMYGSLEPGRMIPNPQCAWAILNVEVRLQEVADLTREDEQERLKTTVQELTGNWRIYLPQGAAGSSAAPSKLAPTHYLGDALFSLPGLEDFLTISAKQREKNLVVFPEKLQAGSRIEFRDPLTGKTHTISGPKKPQRPKAR
jgi:hypothetical protein